MGLVRKYGLSLSLSWSLLGVSLSKASFTFMFTFWVWRDGKNVWNPRELQGNGYGQVPFHCKVEHGVILHRVLLIHKAEIAFVGKCSMRDVGGRKNPRPEKDLQQMILVELCSCLGRHQTSLSNKRQLSIQASFVVKEQMLARFHLPQSRLQRTPWNTIYTFHLLGGLCRQVPEHLYSVWNMQQSSCDPSRGLEPGNHVQGLVTAAQKSTGLDHDSALIICRLERIVLWD